MHTELKRTREIFLRCFHFSLENFGISLIWITVDLLEYAEICHGLKNPFYPQTTTL